MSAIKKVDGLLISGVANCTVDDEDNVEVQEIYTKAEPISIEYFDEDAGEVVYDVGKAAGKSSVGYTRTYASGWDRIFGDRPKECLSN